MSPHWYCGVRQSMWHDSGRLTMQFNTRGTWEDLHLSCGRFADRWLPFADAVLEMTAQRLPSPIEAAPSRLPVLCPRWFAGSGAVSATAVAETARGIVL